MKRVAVAACLLLATGAATRGGAEDAPRLQHARGTPAVAAPRAATSATAPHATATDADSATVGFLLREVHSVGGASTSDTLLTWLAPGRVRVSHRDGDAILDEPRDRFLLLAPRDHTYRSMSLAMWEQRITEALATAASGRHDRSGASRVPDTLRFEPEGDGERVAGHACQRYHLFTRREVFPGEVENVEQEIWVTGELELPPATAATYKRVVANLDRIELDAEVERPPGVTLRTQLRRQPIPSRPGGDETEMTEVIAVERRKIPPGAFEIPAGYVPADSAAADSASRRESGRK